MLIVTHMLYYSVVQNLLLHRNTYTISYICRRPLLIRSYYVYLITFYNMVK